MAENYFSRVVLVNFITALIISLVVCYFLKTVDMLDILYISSIFGLYFFTVYGVKILVESGDMPNNYQRFLYVLLFIIIFDIIFVLIASLLFGNLFTLSDSMALNFHGLNIDFAFNAIYFVVSAILMIIFNFLLYRKDRKNLNQ